MFEFKLKSVVPNPIGSDRYTGLSKLEMIEGDSGQYLLAYSMVSGSWTTFQILPDQPINMLHAYGQGLAVLSDVAAIEVGGNIHIFQSFDYDQIFTVQAYDPVSDWSVPRAVTMSEGQGLSVSKFVFHTVADQPFLITTGSEGTSLASYSYDGTTEVTFVNEVEGSAKTKVTHLSDLETVELGDSTFVVSATLQSGGLNSYRLGSDGTLNHVDTITGPDGLWVSGVNDLVAISSQGLQYLVAACSVSSSLTVVRLNPMGVFFVEDQVHDTRDTRFGGVQCLDTVEVAGRHFIVAAGNDLGLSLFELLPGGELFHHDSIAQEVAWNFGPAWDLAASVVGTDMRIVISGTKQGGVADFIVDLDRLASPQIGGNGADQLTGGALDDLLVGGLGDDGLLGGAGSDILVDGAGLDQLTGGAGADVFVFERDGQDDVIVDFEKGTDRIDLSGWGSIYDPSALTIEARTDGALIRWGAETLQVTSSTHSMIDISAWGADDFIF